MVKVNRLKSTKQIVKGILESDQKARNSDSYLYLKVLDHIASNIGVDLNTITVPYFLEKMDDLRFPGFETVRRTRQLLQSQFPLLGADEKVAEYRKNRELEYRNYVRGF